MQTTIGGAEVAGQAIAEGLVDECHLFARASFGRWWQECPTRRRPCRTRVVGRTPLSQRCRIPALPHLDVTYQSEGHRVSQYVEM